jgi:asparagine synthase (glutamine-hydrolysing)
MPGISLYCSDGVISERINKNINNANMLLNHHANYETTPLFKTEYEVANFTAYPSYPRMIIDNDEYYIFIEGLIYNKNKKELTEELMKLAPLIFTGDEAQIHGHLSRWMFSAQGDYVILFLNKNTNDLKVINDPLGRLPLFYLRQNDKLLISREPKFMVSALDHKEIDPIGMAEFLLFSYNLKHRTSIKDVYKLQPASLISYNHTTKEKKIKTLFEWEFGKDQDGSVKVQDYAGEIAQLLMNSINNRIFSLSEYHPVLALSGGLDSRAIYFALIKAKLDFSSYTSLNSRKNNRPDIEVARQIVNAVPSKWQLYEFDPITLDDYKEVALNQESGSIVMALACDGYRRLKRDFPDNIAFYTGDGGCQIAHPIATSKKLKSLDELVDYTMGISRCFDIDLICRLLRIEKSEVYQSLYDVFSSYPETDFVWKFAHFRTFGRAFRFIMEGEDRSRFYFWLVAPWWDAPLLKVSMRIPEKYKRNSILYRELLRALDARSLDFVYANTGFKLTSPFSLLHGTLKTIAKSQKRLYKFAVKLAFRQIYKKFRDPVLDKYMEMVIDSSGLVKNSFDTDTLNNILNEDLDKIQYYLINTVILRCFLMENRYKYI